MRRFADGGRCVVNKIYLESQLLVTATGLASTGDDSRRKGFHRLFFDDDVMTRLTLLVCLLFVALGVTACGADPLGESGDMTLIVANAADRTKAADTAKMEMVLKAVGDTTESITFNGEIDFARGAASMTLEIADDKVVTVFDRRAMYQRIPNADLPEGKEWVRFDFAELDRRAGGSGDLGGFSAGQQDPTATLEQLRDAGDVTKVGHDAVRGTQTTHYRASFDLNAAAAGGGLEALQARKMIDQLHLSTIPLDVWIDPEGRVWRISQEIDFSKSDLAEGKDGVQKAIVSIEYFDFGTHVDVEVPSSGDTVSALDVPELFGSSR